MDKFHLIFLYPISKIFQEVKNKFAEDERFEIYECESHQEVEQVSSMCPGAVVCTSDSRKMIRLVHGNREFFETPRFKPIVLLKKRLKFKEETFLNKRNVLEVLYEPVTQKSIGHKIEFQLKSIARTIELEKKREDLKRVNEERLAKLAEEQKNRGGGDEKEGFLKQEKLAVMDDDEQGYNVKFGEGESVKKNNGDDSEERERNETEKAADDSEEKKRDLFGKSPSNSSKKDGPDFSSNSNQDELPDGELSEYEEKDEGLKLKELEKNLNEAAEEEKKGPEFKQLRIDKEYEKPDFESSEQQEKERENSFDDLAESTDENNEDSNGSNAENKDSQTKNDANEKNDNGQKEQKEKEPNPLGFGDDLAEEDEEDMVEKKLDQKKQDQNSKSNQSEKEQKDQGLRQERDAEDKSPGDMAGKTNNLPERPEREIEQRKAREEKEREKPDFSKDLDTENDKDGPSIEQDEDNKDKEDAERDKETEKPHNDKTFDDDLAGKDPNDAESERQNKGPLAGSVDNTPKEGPEKKEQQQREITKPQDPKDLNRAQNQAKEKPEREKGEGPEKKDAKPREQLRESKKRDFSLEGKKSEEEEKEVDRQFQDQDFNIEQERSYDALMKEDKGNDQDEDEGNDEGFNLSDDLKTESDESGFEIDDSLDPNSKDSKKKNGGDDDFNIDTENEVDGFEIDQSLALKKKSGPEDGFELEAANDDGFELDTNNKDKKKGKAFKEGSSGQKTGKLSNDEEDESTDEEQEESTEDNEAVVLPFKNYGANLRGVEIALRVQMGHQKLWGVEEEDLLKYKISIFKDFHQQINKYYNVEMAFAEILNGDDDQNIIFNSLPEKVNEISADNYVRSLFEDYRYNEHITISDETFQVEINQVYQPYFQNGNLLGYALCFVKQGLVDHRSLNILEANLQLLRGLWIDLTTLQIKKKQRASDEEEGSNSSGFFKKLFKRKGKTA